MGAKIYLSIFVKSATSLLELFLLVIIIFIIILILIILLENFGIIFFNHSAADSKSHSFIHSFK
jgi:hypothetical protein